MFVVTVITLVVGCVTTLGLVVMLITLGPLGLVVIMITPPPPPLVVGVGVTVMVDGCIVLVLRVGVGVVMGVDG